MLLFKQEIILDHSMGMTTSHRTYHSKLVFSVPEILLKSAWVPHDEQLC